MPRSRRVFLQPVLLIAACAVGAAQQQLPQTVPIPAWAAVKPIDPPETPLPPEEATANVTRFSFVGYGDTRSGGGPNGDGVVVHPEHSKLADLMIAKAKELSATPFPLRFVLQSGDAVLRGQIAAQW